MQTTRIAVVGAGYVGRAHIAVAQGSQTCTLSAVVDPAPTSEALALTAAVPLYGSLEELLARDDPTAWCRQPRIDFTSSRH